MIGNRYAAGQSQKENPLRHDRGSTCCAIFSSALVTSLGATHMSLRAGEHVTGSAEVVSMAMIFAKNAAILSQICC